MNLTLLFFNSSKSNIVDGWNKDEREDGWKRDRKWSREERRVVCSYRAGCLCIGSSWCFPSELQPQSSNSDLSLTSVSAIAPSVAYKNEQLVVCSSNNMCHQIFLGEVYVALVTDKWHDETDTFMLIQNLKAGAGFNNFTKFFCTNKTKPTFLCFTEV